MIDALAPPSCFVGAGKSWAAAALFPGFPDGWPWWQIGLVVFAVFVAYVVVVSGLWYLFLEMFDKRSPGEREFHRREDDEDQARYLEDLQRGHTTNVLWTESEKSFFRFLKAMVPDGDGPKILYIDAPDYRRAYRVRTGGFVFVKGPYEEVTTYFKSHHWERLPFQFRDRHIYRKPR